MFCKYKPSSWRGRVALPGALTVIGAVVVVLVAYLIAGDTSPREEPTGWLILLGMAAIIIWQSVLHAAHAVVAGADLELGEDALMLHMAGGLRGRIALADIRPDGAIQYLYRLGKPERVKGPLIRPRGRYREATFLPVADFQGWRLPLRVVALMVTGGRRRWGVIVTPDHEHHYALLRKLGAELPAD